MENIAVSLFLGLFAGAIILFIYGITKHKQFKKRSTYISECEAMLSEASVSERLANVRQQKSEIEQKQQRGQEFLDKLEQQYVLIREQLARIEVGLVPPIFRFDDSEELKANIRQCREEQFECIRAGEATEAYSKWEWMGKSRRWRSDGE